MEIEKVHESQNLIELELKQKLKKFLEVPIVTKYLNKAETEQKINNFDFELSLDDIR